MNSWQQEPFLRPDLEPPGASIEPGAGALDALRMPAEPHAPTDHRLPPEEARWLHRVDSRYFLFKLAILVVLLTIAVVGTMLSEGLVKLGFQLLLALLLAHATELVHQCLHRTATGVAGWDHALGIALGLPTFVAFWFYLYWHLWHHRKNGTEEDRESFGYAYDLLKSRSRIVRLWGFALHLSMIAHYRDAFGRMALALRGRLTENLRASAPHMPVSIARRIQGNYQLMAAALMAAAAAAIRNPGPVIDLWLIPLLFWGPIHALIELPEHIYCDHPDPDVFKNTRSIRAGRFLCWLTNHNCNHVGHHIDMKIPMDRLVAFERRLSDRGLMKHHEGSYLQFYFRFLRSLWNGRPMELAGGPTACVGIPEQACP